MNSQRKYHPCISARWFSKQNLLPMLLGIVILFVVVMLCLKLRSEEDINIQKLIQQQAIATKTELVTQLNTQILALERMAEHWEIHGGIPQREWELEAKAYLEDYGGYQAIELVEPSWRVRWSVSLAKKSAESPASQQRTALVKLHQSHQNKLTRTIKIVQGDRLFFACVPLWIQDKFDGSIVGVFPVKQLFDTVFHKLPGYKIRVYDGKKLIYSQDTESVIHPSWQQVVSINFYGVTWQLQIYPTAELLTNLSSPLPTVILIAGIFNAGVVTLLIHFAQATKLSHQKISRINQELAHRIEEQTKIESALRASESRLRDLLETVQVIPWELDLKTQRFTYVGPQVETLLAYPVSQWYEENFWVNHLHPHDLSWAVKFCQEATERGENHEFEYRMVAADGRVVWLRDIVNVVQVDGTPTMLRGFMFDITGLKLVEETLRLRERALAASSNGVIIADAILPNYPVIYVNSGFEQITGYKATEVIGKNCRFCKG